VALRNRSLTFSAAMSALSQPIGATTASGIFRTPFSLRYRSGKRRTLERRFIVAGRLRWR
jgi:hypothetical protein